MAGILSGIRVVDMTQYLSGPQGRNYLDLPSFEKAGIEVLYHDYPSDGDNGLSAVHHLFTGAVKWEQTSLDYSLASEAAVADPVAPLPDHLLPGDPTLLRS